MVRAVFSFKPQQFLSLGLAFMAGCVVTVLYNFKLCTLTSQQRESPVVPSDHFRSGKTLSVPEKPDVLRPRVNLPVLKGVLPKANFTSDWTENSDLRHLRTHGAVKAIPDEEVLNTYDVTVLSAIYHSYLDNTDVLCQRKLRLGKVDDGGWEVCDDHEWRPIRPCLIYSFGINNDFSFDDDAGRLYGCDVYSFDPRYSAREPQVQCRRTPGTLQENPSMVKQPTYQRSERVAFYRLGIGGKSGPPEKNKKGWLLHSLSNFRTMLNHTDTPIDILKMDIEQSEWPTLTTMLKEGQLRNVRQLLIEFHYKPHVAGEADPFRSYLKVLGDLERRGFKKFYVHKNPWGTINAVGFPVERAYAYEVHYVNTKFVRASQ